MDIRPCFTKTTSGKQVNDFEFTLKNIGNDAYNFHLEIVESLNSQLNPINKVESFKRNNSKTFTGTTKKNQKGFQPNFIAKILFHDTDRNKYSQKLKCEYGKYIVEDPKLLKEDSQSSS